MQIVTCSSAKEAILIILFFFLGTKEEKIKDKKRTQQATCESHESQGRVVS